MTITEYGKNFDFDLFMRDIEKAFQNYDVPIITLMATREESPFKILISTILSARTKDEVTSEASKRLYQEVHTPKELANMDIKKIEKLIYPVGFYKTKAKNIKKTAQFLIEDYQGKVPSTMEELLELPGVGRKTANLVLGEAFKKDAICVDTHVHRISNRLGILKTKTPHETEMDLIKFLPREYWITYNTFLVGHGQSTCNPISPFCSRCSVKKYCKQVDVKTKR